MRPEGLGLDPDGRCVSNVLLNGMADVDVLRANVHFGR